MAEMPERELSIARRAADDAREALLDLAEVAEDSGVAALSQAVGDLIAEIDSLVAGFLARRSA